MSGYSHGVPRSALSDAMPAMTWERPRKPAKPLHEPVLLLQHDQAELLAPHTVYPDSPPQFPPPQYSLPQFGYSPLPAYQGPTGRVTSLAVGTWLAYFGARWDRAVWVDRITRPASSVVGPGA
jgi:hypothetical protein